MQLTIETRKYIPQVIPKGSSMFFFDASGNYFEQKYREPFEKPNDFVNPIVYKIVAANENIAINSYNLYKRKRYWN